MARYGQEFKDRAVARLLPPESASIKDVANEIGVGTSTLERWRSETLAQPGRERVWTPAARFDAVLTTAPMDEASKSAWCRANGVYPQELATWRENAMQALSSDAPRTSAQETKQNRRKIKELEREVRRKDKALAETAALLVLSKKVAAIFNRDMARTMIGLEDRQSIAQDIDTAFKAGARLYMACEVAGIDVRTLQRWQANDGLVAGDLRPTALRPTPAHALSADERAQVLQVANEPRFADVPPAGIVPILADEGLYVASESTFSRVLRAAGQAVHRGRAKTPRMMRPPTTHVATAPRQVWCWDMTYLPRQRSWPLVLPVPDSRSV